MLVKIYWLNFKLWSSKRENKIEFFKTGWIKRITWHDDKSDISPQVSLSLCRVSPMQVSACGPWPLWFQPQTSGTWPTYLVCGLCTFLRVLPSLSLLTPAWLNTWLSWNPMICLTISPQKLRDHLWNWEHIFGSISRIIDMNISIVPSPVLVRLAVGFSPVQ